MRQDYKVYKARVTKVTSPVEEEDKPRVIYITPLPSDGGGGWEKPATPPNFIPTSTLGSGVLSYPDPGQECIVAEWNGERHILSYINPRNQNPYGNLTPIPLKNGGVALCVNGINSASLQMDRSGFLSLYSNLFAQISVDGNNGITELWGKNLNFNFYGGFVKHNYDPEQRRASVIESYGVKNEAKQFNDSNLRLEEGFGEVIPFFNDPYIYNDKVIIKKGAIEGRSHLYEIQTRQALHSQGLNSQDKDTVTFLKMGYQEHHDRFNNGEISGGGALIEFGGKTVRDRSADTFKVVYGELDDTGALFTRRILSGALVNPVPIQNPMDEGKGWEPGSESLILQEEFGWLSGSYYDFEISSKYMSYSNTIHSDGKVETFSKNGNISEVRVSEEETSLKFNNHEIIIDDSGIIIKAGGSELELTSGGSLRFNGLSLVDERIVDALLTTPLTANVSQGVPAVLLSSVISGINDSKTE